MKETYLDLAVGAGDPKQEQSPRRLPITRDLEGRRCAHCGSCRYILVFRGSGDGWNGILEARCSRCRNPRKLTVGEVEGASHA